MAPLKIGVSGPVGSGKTALLEALYLTIRHRYELAVITNDIYTFEDQRIRTAAAALRPERTLPFAGSRFAQTLRATLEDGAELGPTEMLASGRVLKGERLAFAEYRSRTAIWRGGQRLYLDHQRLTPGTAIRAPGIWGGLDYAASGVFVGAGEVTHWPGVPGRLASGSSAGGAVWLRGVAARGPELDAGLNAAREQLRAQLFGAVPLKVRR